VARRYSPRTIEAYAAWVRRFVRFHERRHPRELGEPAVRAFLTHLARDRHVSASTQNQALAALLFLYRHVLEAPIAVPAGMLQAKRPVRLPMVLTRSEVALVLAAMDGVPKRVASVLYGGGLRLLEGCALRVKDLDLERGELTVRSGKGQKDRRTVLPRTLVAPLTAHLALVRARHARDVRAGAGFVALPFALRRKLGGGAEQTRDVPHVPAFVRDASARGGVRHPHGAGAAGPCGRAHDDGVLARAEPWRPRGAEPAGRVGAGWGLGGPRELRRTHLAFAANALARVNLRPCGPDVGSRRKVDLGCGACASAGLPNSR
jgi:integrase